MEILGLAVSAGVVILARTVVLKGREMEAAARIRLAGPREVRPPRPEPDSRRAASSDTRDFI